MCCFSFLELTTLCSLSQSRCLTWLRSCHVGARSVSILPSCFRAAACSWEVPSVYSYELTLKSVVSFMSNFAASWGVLILCTFFLYCLAMISDRDILSYGFSDSSFSFSGLFSFSIIILGFVISSGLFSTCDSVWFEDNWSLSIVLFVWRNYSVIDSSLSGLRWSACLMLSSFCLFSSELLTP